jgi:hypothetical protein
MLVLLDFEIDWMQSMLCTFSVVDFLITLIECFFFQFLVFVANSSSPHMIDWFRLQNVEGQSKNRRMAAAALWYFFVLHNEEPEFVWGRSVCDSFLLFPTDPS